MDAFIRSYRDTLRADRRRLLEQYRFVHLARKVVGVGSVGTHAWILLLLDDQGLPLFLQVKEAEKPPCSRSSPQEANSPTTVSASSLGSG